MLNKLKILAPDQFENLVFEVVKARGLKNVVWRTPGADGGRDIEGSSVDVDLSGATDTRKWYVECKRHKSTLDWPTVRSKIAYAESNDADFLLIVTTANPTPPCETEIQKWNMAKRRPQIRFWRGYDLPNIIRAVPHVATMFGLSLSDSAADSSLIPLAEVATRISQTSYVRNYFDVSDISAIETAAAISELFSVRLKDLKDFAKPVPGPTVRTAHLFDWLSVDCSLSSWDETSLRAIVSFLKYEFQASNATLSDHSNALALAFQNPRPECKNGLPKDRDIISFWARISASRHDQSNVWLLERLPYA